MVMLLQLPRLRHSARRQLPGQADPVTCKQLTPAGPHRLVRPARRPGAAGPSCRYCHRALMDPPSCYCSLECKLNIEDGVPPLTLEQVGPR